MKLRKKIWKRMGASVLSVVLAITMLFGGSIMNITPTSEVKAALPEQIQLPVEILDHWGDELFFEFPQRTYPNGPGMALGLFTSNENTDYLHGDGTEPGEGLVEKTLGSAGTPVYTKEAVDIVAENVKLVFEWDGTDNRTDIYKSFYNQIVTPGAEVAIEGTVSQALPTYEDWGWSFAKGTSTTNGNQITVTDSNGEHPVVQAGDWWTFKPGTDNTATFDCGTLPAGDYRIAAYALENMELTLEGADIVKGNGGWNHWTFTLADATPVKLTVRPTSDTLEGRICHLGVGKADNSIDALQNPLDKNNASLENMLEMKAPTSEGNLADKGWKTASGKDISDTSWRVYNNIEGDITCNYKKNESGYADGYMETEAIYKEIDVVPGTEYVFKHLRNDVGAIKMTLRDINGAILEGTDENFSNLSAVYDMTRKVKIPEGMNKIRIYLENNEAVDVDATRRYGAANMKEMDKVNLGSYDESKEKFDKNNGKRKDIVTCYDYAYYIMNNLWTDTNGDITKKSNSYESLTFDLIDESSALYGFDNAYEFEYDTVGKTIKQKPGTYNEERLYGLFPLDKKNVGNELQGFADQERTDYNGTERNFHYALKSHCSFIYDADKTDMTFSFLGDDDVYLFLNGELIMDIGGAHMARGKDININELAKKMNIKDGEVCDFDFFYLERHTFLSNIKINTNIPLIESGVIPKVTYSIDGKEITSATSTDDGEQTNTPKVPVGTKVDVTYDVTSTTKRMTNAPGTKIQEVKDDALGVFIGTKDGKSTIELGDGVEVKDGITITITRNDGTTETKTIKPTGYGEDGSPIFNEDDVEDFVEFLSKEVDSGENVAVSGISVPMPADKKLSSELVVTAEAPEAVPNQEGSYDFVYKEIEDIVTVSVEAIPINNAVIAVDGKLVDKDGKEYDNGKKLSQGTGVDVTYTLSVTDGSGLTDITIDDQSGIRFKMDKSGITIPEGWNIPNGLKITYTDVNGNEEVVVLTQTDIDNKTEAYSKLLESLEKDWKLEKSETITVSGLHTEIKENEIVTNASAKVVAPGLYDEATGGVAEQKNIVAEDAITYVQPMDKVTITFAQGEHGTLEGNSEEKIDKDTSVTAVPGVVADNEAEYVFTGNWKMEGDTTDTVYTEEQIKAMTFDKDAKFIAQYEPKTYSYTVRHVEIDKNGNMIDLVEPVKENAAFGTNVTAAVKTDIPNYSLKEGSEINKTIEIKVPESEDDNVIIFEYVKGKISVVFDPKEDGIITEGKDNHSVDIGDKLTEKVPTVTPKDGFEFKGWTIKDATDENKDKVYTAEEIAEMTFDKGTTFEAVYESLAVETGSYIVKYVNENGEPLADDKIVDDVTLGTVVTEDALVFEGYDVDKESVTLEINEGTNEIVFTYKKINVQPTEPTTEEPTSRVPATTTVSEETTTSKKTTTKKTTSEKSTTKSKKGGNYNNSTISPKTGYTPTFMMMFTLILMSIVIAGFATIKMTRKQ